MSATHTPDSFQTWCYSSAARTPCAVKPSESLLSALPEADHLLRWLCIYLQGVVTVLPLLPCVCLTCVVRRISMRRLSGANAGLFLLTNKSSNEGNCSSSSSGRSSSSHLHVDPAAASRDFNDWNCTLHIWCQHSHLNAKFKPTCKEKQINILCYCDQIRDRAGSYIQTKWLLINILFVPLMHWDLTGVTEQNIRFRKGLEAVWQTLTPFLRHFQNPQRNYSRSKQRRCPETMGYIGLYKSQTPSEHVVKWLSGLLFLFFYTLALNPFLWQQRASVNHCAAVLRHRSGTQAAFFKPFFNLKAFYNLKQFG